MLLTVLCRKIAAQCNRNSIIHLFQNIFYFVSALLSVFGNNREAILETTAGMSNRNNTFKTHFEGVCNTRKFLLNAPLHKGEDIPNFP